MSSASPDSRPGLAILANCLTPYRVHLHSLVAAGLPELRVHTLISHAAADFDWQIDLPSEINVTYWGGPGDTPLATLYDAPAREWRKGGRLIDYLRQHDVRAVVCGMPRYMSYVRLVLHGRRENLPVFVNSDANIRGERAISPARQWIKSRWHRWWLRRVAGVMPMGVLGQQYFEKYGADRRRMYFVPYTPDYDYYAAVDSQRLDEFRRKYGLVCERRYLVYSGRLVQAKRVDLLIDAFVRLASERPEWDLIVVGDGVLAGALRRRVPEPLRSRVVWTGFLDQGDPVLAYHAGDVLVLPSDREPWAVVVQEAMAAGMVVVASDAVGAAQDLVEDGVSGRIFAAGSLPQLTQALSDVTQPDRLDDHKRNSRLALDRWKARLDPVAEVRRALVDVGALADATVRPAVAST